VREGSDRQAWEIKWFVCFLFTC